MGEFANKSLMIFLATRCVLEFPRNGCSVLHSLSVQPACGDSPSIPRTHLPHPMSFLKSFSFFALAALAGAGFALGQNTTTPVGYVTIECKANSDTIVGVPLRQSAAFVGTLNGAPDLITTPGSAILTLAGTPGLTANEFANTHYVKFKNTLPTPAAGDGQWFVITANAAGTLTANLNGGSIAAVDGAGLEVIKFWTLAELFNPSQSTNNPATTGNAIVSSAGTNTITRRTSVLIPNYAGTGINLSSAYTFYVLESAKQWRLQGDATTNQGDFQLWPDLYFIIRHAAAVTGPTNYTATGEVETEDFSINLNTQVAISQDNFIALTRPVDVTLNDLNLGGTAAFMSSTGTNTLTRRDQLFVFDNTATGFNKSSSATYFYHNGIWKKSGDNDVDHGSDVIPAGSGIRIRKYKTASGTAVWDQTTPY